MKTKSVPETTSAPAHTKDQRRRLFLLARLLDRVPKDKFDMSFWVTRPSGLVMQGERLALKSLIANKCGYAACAIGWGMTSPEIRGSAKEATKLKDQLMEGANYDNWPRLFGSSRTVGPKRVAKDIRAYLKDGTLPK